MNNGSSQSTYRQGERLKIVEALAKGLNGEIVHRFRTEGATSMLGFLINGETLQAKNDPWMNADDPVGARVQISPRSR
jgi:hypothetical protein